VLSVEHVLEDPPPDVLPWEFSANNVNIRVRWWIKSQRTYEVRSRAGVVLAIKAAAEKVGIDIPKDTTISFAETPLILGRETRPGPAKSTNPRRRAAEAELSPPAQGKGEAELMKPADKKRDPEAEVPQSGELNEGVDAVPR
jgi:hypothetical protein